MINVIIPASGMGTRFGGSTPKQFINLNGRHVLWHSIAAFNTLEIVNVIAVAVPKGYKDTVQNYGFTKLCHVVEGGETRAASVYAALKTMPQSTSIVLVHDGARPFIVAETIQDVAAAAKIHGAAIAASPVTDTIKQTINDKIQATLDRSKLWCAQTPQGFTYDIIMRAYHKAENDGFIYHATDDSQLVERLGIPVYIVPSSSSNIKITTAEDLCKM